MNDVEEVGNSGVMNAGRENKEAGTRKHIGVILTLAVSKTTFFPLLTGTSDLKAWKLQVTLIGPLLMWLLMQVLKRVMLMGV